MTLGTEEAGGSSWSHPRRQTREPGITIEETEFCGAPLFELKSKGSRKLANEFKGLGESLLETDRPLDEQRSRLSLSLTISVFTLKTLLSSLGIVKAKNLFDVTASDTDILFTHTTVSITMEE